MFRDIINIENSNRSLHVAPLSQDEHFRLIYIINEGAKRKSLLFASLAYQNLFFTKSYAELTWIKETLKIFANEKNSDISDGKNFIISQKKHENNLIQKSLHLKFIRGANVYLSRPEARAIVTLANEVLHSFCKSAVLEKKVFWHSAIDAGLFEASDAARERVYDEIKQIRRLKIPKDLQEQIIVSIYDSIESPQRLVL